MSSKEKHLKYITRCGPFKVDCSHEIFSPEELEILKKYGHWFHALTSGALEPYTDLQREFVQVAKGHKDPFSAEEKAWFKYQKRKEIEATYGDRLKARYQINDDIFYNRDMAKQMRADLRRDMQKRRNG